VDTTHLRFGSGQSVRRLEDEQLLRGHGQYADDVVLNAQSRLAFLRSPYPHANIRSIDTTAAQAMPGVHLVLTGAQWRAAGLKDMPPLANFVRPDGKPAATAARCPLAFERVRFVGEPVVAIVADTEQQAKDAAEAVVVDYEELPCAVTLQDALASNAPLLSDAPDNRSAETRYGDAASVDKAFASAKHVVKLDIYNQRVAALSIEPRSVLAYVDQGRLTIRMSSQMPTGVRTVVSTLLGLPAEQVRVVIGDVGGGFGMKTGAYAEDVVTAYCAHRLQRPVKWIADRGEDFLSSAHGRDIQCHAEMALDGQGKVLGLRIRTHANVGAYPGMTGIAIQVHRPLGANQRL